VEPLTLVSANSSMLTDRCPQWFDPGGAYAF
jgi:hypothetical protein